MVVCVSSPAEPLPSNPSYDDSAAGDKTLLLKTLIAAESAATSAAVQLVSFRDVLEEDFSVCEVSLALCAAQLENTVYSYRAVGVGSVSVLMKMNTTRVVRVQ